MSLTATAADCDRLADAELNAAAAAETLDQRRAHLDQASVYATRSETIRHELCQEQARSR